MESLARLYEWLAGSSIAGTGITYLHGLIALVLLWAVLSLGRKVFAGKKGKEYLIKVRCGACGWEGKVSKFTKYCPLCHAANVILAGPQSR